MRQEETPTDHGAALRPRRISVFCGSSSGTRSSYAAAARSLGEELARRGLGLVFGGASVGLMGELARASLKMGGEVIGVMPRGLVEREVALTELSDLRVVGSMHERKALMSELSEGFIALPGGLGTLEELFEVLTWAQLGIHRKPCGLLDADGYFDPLLAFLDRAVEEGFLHPASRALVQADASAARILDRFDAYRAPEIDKARWALDLRDS